MGEGENLPEVSGDLGGDQTRKLKETSPAPGAELPGKSDELTTPLTTSESMTGSIQSSAGSMTGEAVTEDTVGFLNEGEGVDGDEERRGIVTIPATESLAEGFMPKKTRGQLFLDNFKKAFRDEVRFWTSPVRGAIYAIRRIRERAGHRGRVEEMVVTPELVGSEAPVAEPVPAVTREEPAPIASPTLSATPPPIAEAAAPPAPPVAEPAGETASPSTFETVNTQTFIDWSSELRRISNLDLEAVGKSDWDAHDSLSKEYQRIKLMGADRYVSELAAQKAAEATTLPPTVKDAVEAKEKLELKPEEKKVLDQGRDLDRERERLLDVWIDYDEVMREIHDEKAERRTTWQPTISVQREKYKDWYINVTEEYNKYKDQNFPELTKDVGELDAEELGKFLKGISEPGRDRNADYKTAGEYLNSLEGRLSDIFGKQILDASAYVYEKGRGDLLKKYQQLLEERGKIYKDLTQPTAKLQQFVESRPTRVASTEPKPVRKTPVPTQVSTVRVSGGEKSTATKEERKLEKTPMDWFWKAYDENPENCIIVQTVKDEKEDRYFLFRRRKRGEKYIAEQITVYADGWNYKSHEPVDLKSKEDFEEEFYNFFLRNVIEPQNLQHLRYEGRIPDDVRQKLQSATEKESKKGKKV